MLVQNIKHEMKHNGLLRIITKVPEDMRDEMTIGGIVYEEERLKPKLISSVVGHDKALYDVFDEEWKQSLNRKTVVIPEPYLTVDIDWKNKGKRKKIDVLIHICKDLYIKSFTQLIFGSTNEKSNRITWTDKENAFW